MELTPMTLSELGIDETTTDETVDFLIRVVAQGRSDGVVRSLTTSLVERIGGTVAVEPHADSPDLLHFDTIITFKEKAEVPNLLIGMRDWLAEQGEDVRLVVSLLDSYEASKGLQVLIADIGMVRNSSIKDIGQMLRRIKKTSTV